MTFAWVHIFIHMRDECIFEAMCYQNSHYRHISIYIDASVTFICINEYMHACDTNSSSEDDGDDVHCKR